MGKQKQEEEVGSVTPASQVQDRTLEQVVNLLQMALTSNGDTLEAHSCDIIFYSEQKAASAINRASL